MTKREITVWMNVTTSANWNRPAVGIVRVEQALCTELEARLGKARFKQCIWVGGKFVDRDAKAPSNPASVIEAPPTQQPLPTTQRRTSRFQKFAALLSGREKLCAHTVEALPAPESMTVQESPDEPFSAGDILISIGLDWDQSYTPTLYTLRKRKSIKIITCCYDLIPVLFPQYCVGDVASRFTEYFLDVARGSDAILCISKQSEQDLKNLMAEVGSPPPKTCVIRLGDNVPGKVGEISSAVQDLAKAPFILFVSTIERRKNHEVLYRAYHLLCAAGKAESLPKLVFVGMPGWGVGDLLKDIEIDPLTSGLILQLHHVTDAELRVLYDAALFCLYPSLYEGWGLPVGEALSLGKVVLSSDRGSLREVGGQLVRYVDPWSPNAWADAMWTFISDVKARETLERRVREEYKPGSWSETAEIVRGLIDELNARPFQMDLQAGYDLSTQSGEHVGSVIRHSGQPGFLIFGPYRALGVGRYHVRVFDLPAERKSGNGIFEIVSGEEHIHWRSPIEFGSSAHDCPPIFLETVLTLDRPVFDLQFRCVVESGSLTIARIELAEADCRTHEVNGTTLERGPVKIGMTTCEH